ncbi:hypothetical protein [Marimonas arenosa]|uniref:Uncharacterized protein n=1 Tax=Marimonas arenosa TaxID=1795305 RepID=A0AAE3WDD8_9RHOB|nr:hypothetical protein [Marimonas arenosa]MDQ2090642.1 hypothetical protein [Marimonas arenosa]
MKLAIAAFATTFALATSASAMIGPYERAIDEKAAAGELRSGQSGTIEVAVYPAGPNVDWSTDGTKAVTVFDAGTTDAHASGYNAR